MPFIWHPNDPPPELEEHSWAKLQVLRKYLRSYFDTLGVNPARDEFRLDLVDGFAGGGAFRYGNAIEVGTPLIMLEAAKAAEERLNRDRAKPLRFNCKFHFVDVNPNHIAHLRRVLDHVDIVQMAKRSSSMMSVGSKTRLTISWLRCYIDSL